MALRKLVTMGVGAGVRQVLVTEVTRMSQGQVCVAGIDLETAAMVRPLQQDGSNWEEKSWVDADIFRAGNIVLLKPASTPGHPHPPHATEDFRVATVTKFSRVTPAQLYAACVETADADIDAIFAPHLIERKYVVDGAACRSLGCVLVPAAALHVTVTPFDKIGVSWADRNRWYNLSVTELAIRSAAPALGKALLDDRLADVRGRIALRIGLARAWDGGDQGYDPKRCYAQLNGVIVPA